MPIVAYYSKKQRRVNVDKHGCQCFLKQDVVGKALREVVARVKVKIDGAAALDSVRQKPDFVRFCCGIMPIEELIQRRVAEGRSDWYV